MFDAPAPHVFTLPPGVDFAKELVRGLTERFAGQPPEAMAKLRLFVNSQRMRRRVVEVMTADGARFLPRITVLTDLHREPILAGFAPTVSPLRQRLELAKLIGKLLEAQPDLAPRSALYDLADSLSTLLGEMRDEGVSAQTLADIDVSNHSAHWARSQAFLKIIAPVMANQGDDQARQREAALRLAAFWQADPPANPIIIAGSTGSRGATALLMQAVARLELGAVVLPGFDDDLPETVWQAMDDVLTAEDHPQFRFRMLMDALQITPADLKPWRTVTPANSARNRLISLSLRPAPVTDQWLVEGATLPDLVATTGDVTLIEAAGPREEALAIALILRDAVERGVRAALITADRSLSRRVAAALDLWRIVPDDSAGDPLALSA
ncbi:MAG: double-strand break repair protein AddB, partial [Paracoccaceae bacterium]